MSALAWSLADGAEADAHVRVREILHELAQQHEQRKLRGVDADQKSHTGEHDRLQRRIEIAAPIVGPAIHLALTVMQAVQRPPPGKRVLHAMHAVVREIVRQRGAEPFFLSG